MMLNLITDECDTTWAFIRLIEHYNANEWWKPFDIGRVRGEISTFGRIRKCNKPIIIRNTNEHHGGVDLRPYFYSTMLTVYRAMKETFQPNPNPDYYNCLDHRDRNPLNSKLSNIRWSNGTLNQWNKGLRSGTGVYVMRGKKRTTFGVRLCYNNSSIWLGTYRTMEEADEAYRGAVERAFEILEQY